METTIEQLTKEVNEITKSLDELKKDLSSISEQDKKTRVEELNQKVGDTTKKIKEKIDSLDQSVDEQSQKEKKEAEALLNSFNDLLEVHASILNLNGTAQDEEKKDEEKKGEEKKEKWLIDRTKEWVWNQWEKGKWLFNKTTDRIWNQWNDVWDGEKRKNEWWKNLLRTSWFIVTWGGVIALTYKWIKKLFHWWKSSEKVEGSNNTESNQDEWSAKFWDKCLDVVLKIFDRKSGSSSS